MAKLWTAKPSEARDGVELRASPPWKTSSVCIGTSEPDGPDGLFSSAVYWDLMFLTILGSVNQRLQEMKSWADVEGWVARRDTPQCRWLDRLVLLKGHLGEAILELIERKALVVEWAF